MNSGLLFNFIIGIIHYSYTNEIFLGKDSVLQSTETKDSDKAPVESLEKLEQSNQTTEQANLEKEAELGQASVKVQPVTKVRHVLLNYKSFPLTIILL